MCSVHGEFLDLAGQRREYRVFDIDALRALVTEGGQYGRIARLAGATL